MDLHGELTLDTKLYRYMSVESFMSFVETGRISLANVNIWDDRWEVILSKIPTLNDKGELDQPLYSFHERIYGQCWSLSQESDAMWRIYSPSGTGIQLSTSAAKFQLINGVRKCCLGKVVYFESVADLLEKASVTKGPWADALFKRAAFDHENEVRFLTHGDFLTEYEPHWTHVSLPVDPTIFIETVTIDPRADDWYVNAITSYCRRIGLTVNPVRSTLYEPEPHLKLGIAQKWVKVQKD